MRCCWKYANVGGYVGRKWGMNHVCWGIKFIKLLEYIELEPVETVEEIVIKKRKIARNFQ